MRLLLAGLKIPPVSGVIVLEKNSFFQAKWLRVHVPVLAEPVSLGIYSLLWAGAERLLATVMLSPLSEQYRDCVIFCPSSACAGPLGYFKSSVCRDQFGTGFDVACSLILMAKNLRASGLQL